MKNKALVEIYLPAAGKRYDVYIPLDIMMSDVVQLVAALLADLSDGRYKATSDAVLCNTDEKYIYSMNSEPAEQGIENGTRLTLI